MSTTASSQIADPYSLDLKELDPSIPHLFEQQAHSDYFKRLREEDPVRVNSNFVMGYKELPVVLHPR